MSESDFQIPDKSISNPGDWLSSALDESSWHHNFPQDIVDELDHALLTLSSRDLVSPDFSIEDFNTPKTARFLAPISDELENGKGFVVLKGLSIEGRSQIECENLFWMIGLHLGVAVPISADGALMGHVKDLGFDLKKPTVRNYQTTEELTFHNDSCDVLGLMCLNRAKSGGHSAIASAIAIHNEILETRPDLLRALYTPFAIDRRGEKGWPAEGDDDWFALPPFSYVKDKISARYTVHDYYYQSQKFPGAPRMSELQIEALEYLKQVSTDERFRVNFFLEAGDIQLVNNYCVFHSRTQFVDHPEPERKRHLLRLWLSVPNSRELHPIFEKRYRSHKAGALRGGIAPKRI